MINIGILLTDDGRHLLKGIVWLPCVDSVSEDGN